MKIQINENAASKSQRRFVFKKPTLKGKFIFHTFANRGDES